MVSAYYITKPGLHVILIITKSKQTRIKYPKGREQGLNLIVLQKVREQGIRFWNERTFRREIILIV